MVLPASTIHRAEVKLVGPGAEAANARHIYSFRNTLAARTFLDTAAAIDNLWNNRYNGGSNGWQYRGVIIKRYDAVGVLNAQTETFTVAGGGAGTNTIAPVLAVMLRKTCNPTPFPRQPKGRFMWPGADESQIDAAGTLTPAAVTAYQTLADNLLNDHNAADVPIYLEYKPLTSSTQYSALEVTALTVQLKARTVRSRMF